MRWIKRDRWKAGITITGMLLLLVLVVWVPVSAVQTDAVHAGMVQLDG